MYKPLACYLEKNKMALFCVIPEARTKTIYDILCYKVPRYINLLGSVVVLGKTNQNCRVGCQAVGDVSFHGGRLGTCQTSC